MAWNIGWEDMEENIVDAEVILETQTESTELTANTVLPPRDVECSTKVDAEWETEDGGNGRAMPFQFGSTKASILNRSRNRIFTKRSETMA